MAVEAHEEPQMQLREHFVISKFQLKLSHQLCFINIDQNKLTIVTNELHVFFFLLQQKHVDKGQLILYSEHVILIFSCTDSVRQFHTHEAWLVILWLLF